MNPAPRLDVRSNGADRQAIAAPRSRYTVVGKLRPSGRAELSICLPRGAHRVEDVVLVKTFAFGVLERSSGALPTELELASRLHHDNIVRTLGCGSDDGRDFIVTEYLEGVTLRRLLEWLQASGEVLGDAAVARVLLAIFSAVEHAARCAAAPQARALVHQVVAAEDVFITCKGDVKLLGFKPSARFDGASEPSPRLERAAVDALLSTQRSEALSAVLARVGARLAPSSVLGLWQIARALESWQEQTLGSDGRDELAGVMAKLLPEGRATRRAHLEAACARVRRLQLARDDAGREEDGGAETESEPAEEAAPVSGYRTTGAELALQPTGAERALAALPRGGEERALRSEATLPPRPGATLEAPLSVRLPTAPPGAIELGRPSAPPRPFSMDIQAHESSGVRLRWVALAIAAGAAAAFGVHHLVRVPSPEGVLLPGATMAVAGVSTASTEVSSTEVSSTEVVAEVAALVSRARGPAAAPAPEREAPSAPEREPAGTTGLRATGGRWTLPRGEARPGEARPSSARASAAPVMARGYLTLDTTPWSMVSLGGVSLGQTPLVKVELPAGQHVLQLSNPELGLSSSVVVDVVAGVTMVRRIGLERSAQSAAR